MSTREELLLDAAIKVLGTRGMRNLTHRAVDSTAGLPLGSTSNLFRTREALLTGVLGRILERETATWADLASDLQPTTIDELAAALGRLLEVLTEGGRVLSQARLVVFVEASNSPELSGAITRGQKDLATWMTPLLAELGTTDPTGDVQHLLALMDGLLANQLASRTPGFDPTRAVCALLHGLCDGSPDVR